MGKGIKQSSAARRPQTVDPGDSTSEVLFEPRVLASILPRRPRPSRIMGVAYNAEYSRRSTFG